MGLEGRTQVGMIALCIWESDMSERLTTKLKRLIAGPELAVLPGVADALNALLDDPV